jgi:hypothetical protein
VCGRSSLSVEVSPSDDPGTESGSLGRHITAALMGAIDTRALALMVVSERNQLRICGCLHVRHQRRALAGIGFLVLGLGFLASAFWLYSNGIPGNPVVELNDPGNIQAFYPSSSMRGTRIYYTPRKGDDEVRISSSQSSGFPPSGPGAVAVFVLSGGARVQPETLRLVPQDRPAGLAVGIFDVNNEQDIVVSTAGVLPSGVDVEVRARLTRDAIVTENARTSALLPGVSIPRGCSVGFVQVAERTSLNCVDRLQDSVTISRIVEHDPFIRMDYANQQPTDPGDPAWSLGQLARAVPEKYGTSYVNIAEESAEASLLFYSAAFFGFSTAWLSLAVERFYSAGFSRERHRAPGASRSSAVVRAAGRHHGPWWRSRRFALVLLAYLLERWRRH